MSQQLPVRQHRQAIAGSSNWHVIKAQIKYIDLLIEVCDARAPLSSRHPKVAEMFAGKPVLLVLGKADLADEKILPIYLTKLNQSADQKSIALSLKESANKKAILSMISSLTAAGHAKLAKKGIRQRATRICVIGMPNVGKSSLINWLVGRNRAKAANKPGITRGPQWIRLESNLELLDTPGILPKDSMGQSQKDKLAILNLLAESSDDEILANKAIMLLKEHYLPAVKKYFDASDVQEINLENLARQRGFLSPGGKYNLMRAASTLLTDLRSGKLGGVCLDRTD